MASFFPYYQLFLQVKERTMKKTNHRKPFYMLKFIKIFILISLFTGLLSCEKEERNPNIPDVFINFTLDPNSTFYQELNTAGGWMYLTSELPSRGIIVHRITLDEFVAFDRLPPNDPNRCCEGTNCTRLIFDGHYTFAKDTCTETLYSLLDGSIFDGEGRYPLIRYNAVYSGGLLRVFN